MTTPPRGNGRFDPASSDRGLGALSEVRVPVSRRPDEASARTGAGRGQGKGRRGPADPVRALIHHHHDLCARAVDPLEIAAGLEAHGVTDRTAARFRHRDVFSLAEELYARVPRAEEPAPPPAPRRGARRRRAWRSGRCGCCRASCARRPPPPPSASMPSVRTPLLASPWARAAPP
ncbi:hypothetical protein SANT12839_062000 [Streptomyces antimycoticus]|uniref:Uncharacterized protein n=1 Tax=Streptomyces antimycoticus TaxID=68175 RepID=A0A4D4KFF7_9ACTN|nr:hypothetical protein SANT12839_062000 [Streptomyces antimycoticus]